MRRLALLLTLAACNNTTAPDRPKQPETVKIDTTPATSVTTSEPAKPLEVPNATSTPAPNAIVRETKKVKVDNVEETWTLRWKSQPADDCIDNTWYTAPCQGLAYGETGHLELVRERAGTPAEVFNLDPLFPDGKARLARWPTNEKDPFDKDPNVPEIKKRSEVSAMNLGDFDHDGRATEFALFTEPVVMGHVNTVIIGISKSEPKLHVFANDKNEPLILDRKKDWEKVRDAKTSPVTIKTVTCGDHGADQEEDDVVTFGPTGLSIKRVSHKCAGPAPKP